jgi:hypothetical protein
VRKGPLSRKLSTFAIEELSSLDLSTRAQGDSKSGIEVLTCPPQESYDRNAVGDSTAGVRRPATTTGRRRRSVSPVGSRGQCGKIVDRPLLLELASSISGNSPGTRSGHRGFGQVRPGPSGAGARATPPRRVRKSCLSATCTAGSTSATSRPNIPEAPMCSYTPCRTLQWPRSPSTAGIPRAR